MQSRLASITYIRCSQDLALKHECTEFPREAPCSRTRVHISPRELMGVHNEPC